MLFGEFSIFAVLGVPRGFWGLDDPNRLSRVRWARFATRPNDMWQNCLTGWSLASDYHDAQMSGSKLV